jgi:hypothetical protein
MAHGLIRHEVADFAAWTPRDDARPDIYVLDDMRHA